MTMHNATNIQLATMLPEGNNRETLYWNSNLQIDNDNKIHFSFYNSDFAKKFALLQKE